MAKRSAAEVDPEEPAKPLKTYADVPVAEMDALCTRIQAEQGEAYPSNAVSSVFLGWIRESSKTGFIPPPPPAPSPAFMAQPPNVELTAKGLPSFRCGRERDPSMMWLCSAHNSIAVPFRHGDLAVVDMPRVWRFEAPCWVGSALDV